VGYRLSLRRGHTVRMPSNYIYTWWLVSETESSNQRGLRYSFLFSKGDQVKRKDNERGLDQKEKPNEGRKSSL